jgi:predicted TIM-barrel enzyme
VNIFFRYTYKHAQRAYKQSQANFRSKRKFFHADAVVIDAGRGGGHEGGERRKRR